MLEAIRAAKKSINFEAYIFKSDAVGQQFRDALCEKARAGVEVRVLLDGVGSGWGLDNSDVRMMKDAGCKFAYYHPVASWRVDRTNRRSHRRVLVIDGKIGFTGGAAFSDKWSGHAQDEYHWRDTHARLEGPIVNDLQASFQGHWVKTFHEALTGDGQFPAIAPAGNLKAQIVESRSFSSAPIPCSRPSPLPRRRSGSGSRILIARRPTIRSRSWSKRCSAESMCGFCCPDHITISR